MDRIEAGSVVAFSPAKATDRVPAYKVPALVAQSHVATFADTTSPNGVRAEEELVLIYLDPTKLKNVMSGEDIRQAVVIKMGAKPMHYNGNEGVGYQPVQFRFLAEQTEVPLSVPQNPHPENIQYSPEHFPQHETTVGPTDEVHTEDQPKQEEVDEQHQVA